LQAAEAHRAGADVAADAAALVAERYRQQLVDVLAPAMEAQRRQLQQIATGILAPAMETQRRQLQQIATGILAPAMETQRRQLQQIATGMVAAAYVQSPPAAPGPVPSRPPTTWPPARQLVLHAMMTAVIASLVLAYLDAKLASDPEEALLNLLFAIGFWYQLHCELWK
jgi:hypothetical protein